MTSIIGGAALGAIVGSLLDTISSKHDSSPTGVLFGLLVGGILDTIAGSQQGDTKVDESRIMTLAYDPALGSWKVYHGPYHEYAISALYPNASI